MPNTYFDSDLTGEQIDAALKAIDGVVTPENNGKVLVVENGKIVAKSASAWTDAPVLEPLSVAANGDYTPGDGVDGYNAVHVAVPGATLIKKSITQNGTYNASQDDADGYSSVTVVVPGGATIEPLEVTQNGTYNPPSGVDGYSPVTVNVSGGSGDIVYVPYAPEYEQGAASGTIDYSYASNKTSSTTRIRPVDTVDVSQFLNDKVLLVWDESQYDIAIQQYSARGSLQNCSTWYTQVTIVKILQPNIAIMIRKKSEADITSNEFASVNLKLVSLTDSVF